MSDETNDAIAGHLAAIVATLTEIKDLAEVPRTLSLHDNVAFRAMQAMLSNPDIMADFGEMKTKLESFDQFIARRSYDISKAMLDERRKRIDQAGGRRGEVKP